MKKNTERETGAVKFTLKQKKTEKRKTYQISNKKQINYIYIYINIYTCISCITYNTFVEYQYMKKSTFMIMNLQMRQKCLTIKVRHKTTIKSCYLIIAFSPHYIRISCCLLNNSVMLNFDSGSTETKCDQFVFCYVSL